MASTSSSPTVARWLLSVCLHEVDRELVLGDLEETYYYLAKRYGRRRADRWYWSQVLRSIPSFVKRTTVWSLVMLKSYLKIARRHLTRNGVHTAINVVGLGTALALCIVAYVNWQYDAQYDAFHVNADRIFRINSEKAVGEDTQRWGISPLPLAEAAARDIPGIERTTRWRTIGAVVRRDDNVFNERIALADPDFFQMFTFPMAAGTTDALGRTDQIILSKDAAGKYFGDRDALGQPLTVGFQNGKERTFTVGGILEDYPPNSSFVFGFLLPMDVYVSVFDVDTSDWKAWGQLTFVEVQDPARIDDITQQLQRYIPIQNEARQDWKIERFYAQPLRRIAPESRMIYGNTLYSNMPKSAVIGPAVMAVLVLLMACFNFINLSIVSSGRRMKEIGLRKVMGGRRRQMVMQLLGESLLLCLLALALALYLAKVFTPLYNSLWPEIDIRLTYGDNVPLLAFLAGLTLVTALLAGLYPAFYASAFSPIRILRGSQRLGGAGMFSRVLLGFQFSLTIIGVAGSLIFVANARYQKTMDMGYDREALVVVPLAEPVKFEPFREALQQDPDILDVAGTTSHIATSWYSSVIEQKDEEHSVNLFDVGEHYVETAGLRVVAGRAFQPNREADQATSILVNQKMVEAMGWDDPIGQVVTKDTVRYSVVGVVANFFYNGAWRTVEPAVLRLASKDDYTYVVARTTPDRILAVNTFLEKTWHEMAPDVPYDGFAQNDALVESIEVSDSIRKLFSFAAILTLLIAGTGLFALVSLNIARRTKEIGIRKVLGASVLHIGRLINTQFVALIGIAAVVGGIAGYVLMDLLLGSVYAYHIAVGPAPFVYATLLILLVALLTVGGKVYRAGAQDPVTALRTE